MTLNVAVQMDHISQLQHRRRFHLRADAGGASGAATRSTTTRPTASRMRDGARRGARRAGQGARPEGRPFHARRRRSSPISPSFDVVLLRQDPPFDMAYITTTHLLERIHPETLVVNDPAHVRNAPEKLFVTEFPELMPPTLITRDPRRDPRVPQGARRHHHQAALRQWRRRRVPHRRGRPEPRARCSRSSPPPSASRYVVQRYLPEVRKGDKRIILDRRRSRSAPSTACRRRARRAPTCMSAAARSRPS